jgi:hypothetical protein
LVDRAITAGRPADRGVRRAEVSGGVQVSGGVEVSGGGGIEVSHMGGCLVKRADLVTARRGRVLALARLVK